MKKKVPTPTDPVVRWRDAPRTPTTRSTVKVGKKTRAGLYVTEYALYQPLEPFIEHNIEVAERVLERSGLWPHPTLGRTGGGALAVHNSLPAEDNSAEKFAAAIVYYGKEVLEEIAKNNSRVAVDAALQMEHFVYLAIFKPFEKDAVSGAAFSNKSKRKPADVERKQQVLRARRASHPDWREKAILAEASTILSAEGVPGVSPRTLRRLKK